MIVLTEQAGIPIQFQRQEVGALAGDTPIRPLAGGPFSRTLDSRDRLLLRLWSAGPEVGEATFVVWRRFTGEDPAGRSVVVDVRFHPAQLQDPGRSTVSRGAPSGSARPPAERLKELDALRQQRLITEEEYETARKRILQGL